MFCPNCGEKIAEDSVFCSCCGCTISSYNDNLDEHIFYNNKNNVYRNNNKSKSYFLIYIFIGIFIGCILAIITLVIMNKSDKNEGMLEKLKESSEYSKIVDLGYDVGDVYYISPAEFEKMKNSAILKNNNDGYVFAKGIKNQKYVNWFIFYFDDYNKSFKYFGKLVDDGILNDNFKFDIFSTYDAGICIRKTFNLSDEDIKQIYEYYNGKDSITLMKMGNIKTNDYKYFFNNKSLDENSFDDELNKLLENSYQLKID